MTIKMIISGGQTGADRGGLEAAKILGIQTSGFAPGGYHTEKGSDYALRDVFGLVESRRYGYKERTLQNILSADMTILISYKTYSPGTNLTRNMCLVHNKPLVEVLIELNSAVPFIPLVEIPKTTQTVTRVKPRIINIAGNRESVCPGIEYLTKEFLIDVINILTESDHAL